MDNKRTKKTTELKKQYTIVISPVRSTVTTVPLEEVNATVEQFCSSLSVSLSSALEQGLIAVFEGAPLPPEMQREKVMWNLVEK